MNTNVLCTAEEIKPGDTFLGRPILRVEPFKDRLLHLVTGHNTYICIHRNADVHVQRAKP